MSANLIATTVDGLSRKDHGVSASPIGSSIRSHGQNALSIVVAILQGACLPASRCGVIFQAVVVLLSLQICAAEALPGQQWSFDGITISESTALYERAALSTAGRPNANNKNLNVPDQSGFQLATTHNSLDFMRTNLIPQFAVALQPSLAHQLGLDAAAFYFQGFVWWDVAPFLDSALNKVNQSARQFNRWPGDGWSLNSFGTNELLAEVMDAYFDLRKDFGPFSLGLRLGKERLENGHELDRLFRVSNVIDSIDFRRDIVFPDPFGSIDSFVIGQWTVQPTLYFNDAARWHLSNSFITGWSSQFQPDYFPAAGTAISLLPSNLVLYNANVNKLVGGTMLGTTLDDSLDLRINYYHTGQGHGIFYTPPGYGPCSPDNIQGKPAFNCQRRTFPVDDIVGGTFNYYIPQSLPLAESILSDGSFGGSIEYRPTMVFPNPSTKSGTPFVTQGNLTFALSFRNSWPLFSKEYRTYGLAAYEYDSNANPINEASAPGQGNPNGLDLLDLFLAQPLPHNLTAAAAAMPSCLGDGSLRVFAELQYQPSPKWLLAAMYDYWGGSAHNPTSLWGPFSSFDQLVLHVGYFF
jgi:hypothetical protein